MSQIMDAEAAGRFDSYYRSDFNRVIRHLMISQGAAFQEAEEVTQTAMMDAWRNWEHINHPHAYVRTVACRELARVRQRDQRERLAAQREATEPSNPPDPISECLDRHTRRVLSLLEGLGRRQREVIALRLDGYKFSEIAEYLATTEATARSSWRHAMKTLRRHLPVSTEHDDG